MLDNENFTDATKSSCENTKTATEQQTVRPQMATGVHSNGSENDDLEYLRAKYLGKRSAASYAPTTPANTDATVLNAPSDSDELQAMRAKYLGVGVDNHRTDKTQRICNIIVICAVGIATLCALIWFSTPILRLGGSTTRGETKNVFSFLFFGKESMWTQVRSIIDNPKTITSDFNILRNAILALCCFVVLIKVTVYAILSVMHFVKHNAVKLCSAGAGAVCNIFTIPFYFSFIGSLAGGSGADSYYVGYTAGIGLIVGLAIGMGGIVAAIVFHCIKNRDLAACHVQSIMNSTISCVGHLVILSITLTLSMYGIALYGITSVGSAAAYASQYSFAVKTFLFPVLNLVLFSMSAYIHNRAVRAVRYSLTYLSVLDEISLLNENPRKWGNKWAKRATLFSMRFTATIIMSAIALFCTFLLRMPSVGLGWDYNFYPQLISILAVSAVGQVLNGVLFKRPATMPQPQLSPQNSSLEP